MVELSFTEAFSEKWIKQNIKDSLNELVILRQIIPWQRIIEKLVPFYCEGKGRVGKSLRMMVAILIVARLRNLSDAAVVEQVKENRYVQYFCNVPEQGLQTFLDASSLCTFRKRLGVKGAALVEEEVFARLLLAGVMRNDAQLIDSSVLESNVIYPTDVLLVYKAFGKMKQFAERNEIPLWWDEEHLKKRWRAYNLAKKNEKRVYLWEFYFLFISGLELFRIQLDNSSINDKECEKGHILFELLSLLDVQTQQKLAGETHIKNRIVSLDEIDARPIKKGKSHPSCEFGTTLQMSFNRDGFMITAENFIGQPGDKSLYPSTLEWYRQRMKTYPELAITDLGFRSQRNFNISKGKVQHVFLGRNEDVLEEKRDFCRRARSATEGFIAVAKNLRGFGRSLYRGLAGDKIWTLLCQTAHHLKKFVQLYRKEKIEEKSLIKLSLLSA